MADKRAPGRSLDEWMELVTECRQSGLTDAAWCNERGISSSCFYNTVSRLRKKACQVPDPVRKASNFDLTSHKQDVVQIAIEPKNSPVEMFPNTENSSMYFDNSHTIEIETKGLLIVRRHTVVGANRILFFRESPARSCRAGNCRTFFPAWRYIVVALFEEQRCCF